MIRQNKSKSCGCYFQPRKLHKERLLRSSSAAAAAAATTFSIVKISLLLCLRQ